MDATNGRIMTEKQWKSHIAKMANPGRLYKKVNHFVCLEFDKGYGAELRTVKGHTSYVPLKRKQRLMMWVVTWRALLANATWSPE